MAIRPRSRKRGRAEEWFERRFEDHIILPGTTDENRKGAANPARDPARLTRVYPYVGAAWYQRDIDVPASWNGKRIVLVLERTKTSRLWVDDHEMGTKDSLVAPHEYELKALAAGRHRLTLRINNAEHAPIGDPHQISDHTQTNWNGVIGRIGLRVTDPVWIDEVQVYPDQPAHRIRVRVAIGNGTGNAVSGSVMLGVGGMRKVSVPFSAGTVKRSTRSMRARRNGTSSVRRCTSCPSISKREALGSPRGHLRVEGVQGTGRAVPRQWQDDVSARQARRLRFPLTGYPPMTAEGWLQLFRIAQSYGINHYRFHTWFPPESAFEAADQLGIYLQSELPNWQAFGEAEHDQFMRAEGERIL